jgi:hypothetical protein
LNLNQWARAVHENAVQHGWWETERPFAEVVALCHSELSEALEAYRRTGDVHRVEYDLDAAAREGITAMGKPEGVPVELVDCLIRILDCCGAYGLDVESVLVDKHQYNKLRPYRHGGKKA